jgi:hypothetical protein
MLLYNRSKDNLSVTERQAEPKAMKTDLPSAGRKTRSFSAGIAPKTSFFRRNRTASESRAHALADSQNCKNRSTPRTIQVSPAAPSQNAVIKSGMDTLPEEDKDDLDIDVRTAASTRDAIIATVCFLAGSASARS